MRRELHTAFVLLAVHIFMLMCTDATHKFEEGEEFGVVHVYPSRYGLPQQHEQHKEQPPHIFSHATGAAAATAAAAASAVAAAASADEDDEPNCTTDTAIMDKLLNGTGYNRFRLPRAKGVEVAVEFWLQAITSIDEITSDFQVS